MTHLNVLLVKICFLLRAKLCYTQKLVMRYIFQLTLLFQIRNKCHVLLSLYLDVLPNNHNNNNNNNKKKGENSQEKKRLHKHIVKVNKTQVEMQQTVRSTP